MGAKQSAALILCSAMVLSGCAVMKRLAPPGFVKYEEISDQKPPNPVIVQRIEEIRAQKSKGYPNLSEQPQAAPARPTESARTDELARLSARGADLRAGLARDQASMAADNAASPAPETEAASLAAAIAVDKAAAAAEPKP